MRKRNTPIRMITVRPARPRRRMLLALARRFGIGLGTSAASPAANASRLEYLDPDQRVREVGEW